MYNSIQITIIKHQKPYKTYAPSLKQKQSTKSHVPTRNKGKDISKPITPPSESASEEEDGDPKQAQRDKDMQKNLAHIVIYFKKIYKPTNNNGNRIGDAPMLLDPSLADYK
ncbi:hypothetical protein Tco_1548949 [Tanacetum coccineum]